MSEKNEAVARRLMDEVWNKGDLKLIDQLLTSDHMNNDPMNPGRGPEVLREVVQKYRTAFPDCRFDIDEMFSAGDKVVARWRYSGTHRKPLEGIPPTGRRVKGSGIAIHRFLGDRIQESYVNWDALGMMQQLGVVTLPGKAAKAGA
jgi:steroid delta-isomerase-like uncharacterized protein